MIGASTLRPSFVPFCSIESLRLSRGVQIELPIQQAFVPLNVMIARDLRKESDGRFDEKIFHQREYVDERVLLSDIFKWAGRFGHRGVLLLGDPGAGKTTGAQQFCWQVLTETDLPKFLGLRDGTVPVFLRLRHLTLPHVTQGLSAFIADSVAAPTLSPNLAQPGPDLLARRGVLWIFDGLDEVVDEATRIKVCGWIRQALEDRTEDYFVVTSRYQGYHGRVDLGPAFCQFHVKPLTPEQVAEYVDHWYRAVCRKLHGVSESTEAMAVGYIKSLMVLLRQPEYRIGRLRELPANPLMLTILCVVHHLDRNLPRRRADLYAKCVRVLVEHWRKDMLERLGVGAYDPEAAEGVLASVAWWLHEQEGRTSQTLEAFGGIAEKALAGLALGANLGRDGAEFIRRMQEQCGILAMWQPGQCGFLHLTFQEYLVGLYAVREGQAEVLVGHLGKSWWREAILVSVAVGTPEFVHKFYTAWLRTEAFAQHGALIDQCLEEARYLVLEPFLKALREPQIRPDRQLEILRLLRPFEQPELVAICQEMVLGQHLKMSGLAQEILQRAGKWLESHTEIEVEGPGVSSYVNPITTIAFVSIPAGEFDMGTAKGVHDDERPVHRVRISSSFLLGKYPVTNWEYQRFLEANLNVKPPAFWTHSQFSDPQQPVVDVSWDEAQAFCKWSGCRLPTEAEWEYACRARTTTEFYLGDSLSSESANFDGGYPYGNAKRGPYLQKTSPVGSYEPNPFGLYDMHGNVWEWCQDWNGPYPSKQVIDPTGPDQGQARVLRGGSWLDFGENCRSAFRSAGGPSSRYQDVGFRVVLVPRSVPQQLVGSGAKQAGSGLPEGRG